MKKRTSSSKLYPLLSFGLAVAAILACSRPGQQQVVYITATFPSGERVIHGSPTPNQPTDTPISPTGDPTRDTVSGLNLAVGAPAGPIPNVPAAQSGGGSYTVRAGDTLAQIATAAGVSLEALMAANNLSNPNLIRVGQVLVIPSADATAVPTGLPTEVAVVNVGPITGPGQKLIPDSELVYSPSAAAFDPRAYMKLKSGFLRAYSDEKDGAYVSGVELLIEVALNYSLNPRLLLALLEYRGGWVESPTVDQMAQEYPMGLIAPGRTGLYRQLLDAANILNAGYYGWKYRGFSTLTFGDGRQVRLSPDLNAGTAAVQYFLSQYNSLENWQVDVGPGGFFQLYQSLFGDPFIGAYEPLIPPDLMQPALSFPFSAGEVWYFTGGPHGGYNSGSAWASIDFAPPAPPDELIAQQGFCYVSPFWVTAVADGVVARSGGGFVILDLDGDGNEYTGWTIVYLHLADNAGLVAPGTRVQTGDRLGNPSCTGGFSSATHLHFGRRYNGEWMPIDCFNCPKGVRHVPMVLSGWTVSGFENQEYQGTMSNAAGGFRRAEQGRDDPINELSW